MHPPGTQPLLTDEEVAQDRLGRRQQGVLSGDAAGGQPEPAAVDRRGEALAAVRSALPVHGQEEHAVGAPDAPLVPVELIEHQVEGTPDPKRKYCSEVSIQLGSQ